MKKTVLILLSFLLLTCERDDICAETTLTTPRLVMDFVDLLNIDNAKSVTDFRVEDIDDSTIVLNGLNGTTDATGVILPLKTTEDMTQFVFYLDYEIDDNDTPDDTSDDIQLGNADIITIEYAREEVYVSRACGYKTIFRNVEVFVEPDTDGNWIQLIQPLNDNQSIEDETTTHFSLLH